VVQCNIRDITVRRRAEKALRENEEKYRVLFECSHDALMTLEPPSWDFTSGNQASVNMFRAASEEEFISSAPWDLSPERQPDGRPSAEKAREMIETAMREGSRFFAWTHKRLDGGEFSATVLLTKLGRAGKTFLQATVRDVTEQKRAEEELRQSEERNRTILHTAMDGFWVADTQGRLLDVNDACCRMSGYSEQELLAMCIPELEANEEEDTATAHFQKIITQGEDRFETRLRRKDGTLFDVEVSVQYKTDEGGRFVAFLHDITERKQAEAKRAGLEAQLQQAQKMESVGRLAGGVAHDFNNMLAVILGYTEVAMGQVSPDLPLHGDLEEVHKAGKRAADLTRQLLAFARRQTVMPKVLDLNDAVAGILKMLHRLVGEDIRLNWHPGADLWPVRMDPSQVDQILANLCVNARDAIADVGKITIETENRTIDECYLRRSRGLCARRVCAAHRERQRLRHGQGNAGPDFRAVLHNQRDGQRYRSGFGDPLRHCQTEQRPRQRLQRGGARNGLPDLTCPGMRAGANRHRRRTRRRQISAAARPFCWWRTSCRPETGRDTAQGTGATPCWPRRRP